MHVYHTEELKDQAQTFDICWRESKVSERGGVWGVGGMVGVKGVQP